MSEDQLAIFDPETIRTQQFLTAFIFIVILHTEIIRIELLQIQQAMLHSNPSSLRELTKP